MVRVGIAGLSGLLVAGAATLFGSGPVAAALITTTFTGTLSGDDGLALFGGGSASGPATLTFAFNYPAIGAPSEADYEYDPSTGALINSKYLGPGSVTLAYNGQSYGYDDSMTALTYSSTGPMATSGINYTATNTGPLGDLDVKASINSFIAASFNPYFGQSQSFNSDPGFDQDVEFKETGLNGDVSDFFLGATNVTVSAVPEPATWAFMICGFGFIGGAMRRQRGGIRWLALA